jgi:flagellar hook assembly protein FlgD
MLSQNYPNPFNPSTQIRFGLPQESVLRLKIYNILGQEVASLADEVRPAGYFVATWDGTNNAGSKVGTGVYFYRFEAKGLVTGETFTSLKKMMLVK